MNRREQILTLLLLRRRLRHQKRSKPRKFWTNPVYLKRIPDGEFYRIYLPMKRLAEQGDADALRRFYQYVQMDFVAFIKLLNLLRNRLTFNLKFIFNF